MAAVFSGVAVSGALGVPLGTLAGEMLGWRGAFAAVALLGVVAWAALAVLLPSLPGATGGIGAQLRYALAPRVLAVLVLHVLVFGALYAAVTYIAPFLQGVTRVSGPLLSVFLLVYGVANAVGSLLGGRFADRDAARTLLVGTATIAGRVARVAHGRGCACARGRRAGGSRPGGRGHGALAAIPGDAAGRFGWPAGAVAARGGRERRCSGRSVAGGLTISGISVSAAVLTGAAIAVGAAATAWTTRRLTPPPQPTPSTVPGKRWRHAVPARLHVLLRRGEPVSAHPAPQARL